MVTLNTRMSEENWKKIIDKERKFVNDAVRTHHYHYPRKLPIIPHYNALNDEHCGAYFASDEVSRSFYFISFIIFIIYENKDITF